MFAAALQRTPGLQLIAVLPRFPDQDGRISKPPNLLGRERAIATLRNAAPGRVAFYGLESPEGVPVYVHAKVCIIDDQWASVGSDNFNRRSWTHDSELSCVVLDEDYARSLRLRLAAEHLDRLPALERRSRDDVMGDVNDPHAMYDAYAAAASALDSWHEGGRIGPRPPGRLRTLPLAALGALRRKLASVPLNRVHDPDGRPGPLRGGTEY